MNPSTPLSEQLQSALEPFVAKFPVVMTALLVFIAFVVAGAVAGRIVGGIARRLKVDAFVDIGSMTDKAPSLSTAIAGLVRLMLWLVGAIVAADIAALPGLAQVLNRALGFLPQILGALFLVVVGLTLANLVRRFLAKGLKELGIPSAEGMSRAAYGLAIVLTGTIVLGELELNTSSFVVALAVVMGGAALALALGIGLGSRTAFEDIFSGIYRREVIRPKQVVEVILPEGATYQGTVVAVGRSTTRLRGDDGVILIPNRVLARAVVRDRSPQKVADTSAGVSST